MGASIFMWLRLFIVSACLQPPAAPHTPVHRLHQVLQVVVAHTVSQALVQYQIPTPLQRRRLRRPVFPLLLRHHFNPLTF